MANRSEESSHSSNTEPAIETSEMEAMSDDSNINMGMNSNNGRHNAKETGGYVCLPVTIQRSDPSYGKHQRGATVPPGIDLHNVIDLESPQLFVHEEDEKLPPPEGTYSAPSSSYNLRNRGVNQSKLAYDVKYHPMDDSIRPSQAAKRRSAHGEIELLSDNSCASFSEPVDAVNDSPMSIDDQNEACKATKKVANGKKRSRTQSQEPEPSRRSARKISCPKTSYNMAIHPQDEDLEILDANDSEVKLGRKRRKVQRTCPTIELDSDGEVAKPTRSKHRKHAQPMDSTSLDKIEDDDESMISHENGFAQDVETSPNENIDSDLQASPWPVLSLTTPHPHGIRRKEGLDIWDLSPGHRYFRHDRDSWPVYSGSSFEIFEECLEDQLAAEACALSPLNYEHDDKENNTNYPNREPTPGSVEGISVMPASQYRQSNDDIQASRQIALNSDTFNDALEVVAQPYNLGGNEVTSDEQTDGRGTGALLEDMHNFVSGSHLSQARATEENHIDSRDSVFGSSSPRSVDSVLGS